MALLLRMGGVPARVATGFSPGGFSERKDAWIVRDTDAHSWVEVWFDEFGWVTIDPTPAATPARSQIAALERPPETDERDDECGGDAGGLRPSHGRRAPGPARRRRRASGAGGGAAAAEDGGTPWWWFGRGRGARDRARRLARAALAPRAAQSGGRRPGSARSPSSRPRCAGSAARAAEGLTLQQLEQAARPLARGGRVPPRAARRPLRPDGDAPTLARPARAAARAGQRRRPARPVARALVAAALAGLTAAPRRRRAAANGGQ